MNNISEQQLNPIQRIGGSDLIQQSPIDTLNDKRLHERLALVGHFIVAGRSGETKRYKLMDISLGGLRIKELLDDTATNDFISGRLEVTAGNITVSGDATCQVLVISQEAGTRMKFVEISEEFIEFLRAHIWRENIGSDLKTDWLSRSASASQLNVATNGNHSLLRKIFRFETALAALLIGLAFLTLVRATEYQVFWLTSNFDIVAPISATINSLQDTTPIDPGDQIAKLETVTISEQRAYVAIQSPSAAHVVTWIYNVGDKVNAGDVIGYGSGLPLSNGRVQAIAAVDSPFYALAKGDEIVFTNGTNQNIRGIVSHSITPERVATHSGVDQNMLKFTSYHVVELSFLPDTFFPGDLKLNRTATFYSRVRSKF